MNKFIVVVYFHKKNKLLEYTNNAVNDIIKDIHYDYGEDCHYNIFRIICDQLVFYKADNIYNLSMNKSLTKTLKKYIK